MPKSRGRRTGRAQADTARRRERREPPGLGELAPFLPVLRETDAAEARGDVLAAVGLIAAHPVGPDGKDFWRGERLRRLSQLVTLEPILPRWATSRWILAQALQGLYASNRGRHLKALEVAIRTRGGLGTLPGSAEEAQVAVMDRDWVFRQLFLYELGGLEHFVTRVASPDLLVGADRIEDWMRAPMGAYRLMVESPRVLTWEALDSGECCETINIGSATLLEPGDCALGRRVPIEGGAMFETVPLCVSDAAAARVAADPAGWIDAVAAACRERGDDDEPACCTGGHDFGLLTDVPVVVRLIMQRWVTERNRSRGRPGDTGPVAEAAALVHAAVAGELGHEPGVSPWPAVAAALVEPHVLDRVIDGLAPDAAPALTRLADNLAGPAVDLCRSVGRDLRESA